jgi:acetyltransferase-like isoleucine patch superfamily enzyme
MSERFPDWKPPEFDEKGMTKWQWKCQYHENLELEPLTDIGSFTYINARFGVEIQEGVEVGSHCSIYSHSTIDNKEGKVIIKKGAKIGSHSVVMPGVTIGENAVIGAFSFVNKDIPAGAVAFGVPVRVQNKE